jgi:hypothetical protein
MHGSLLAKSGPLFVDFVQILEEFLDSLTAPGVRNPFLDGLPRVPEEHELP